MSMKEQNSLRRCNVVALAIFLTEMGMHNHKKSYYHLSYLSWANFPFLSLEFLETFANTSGANLPTS